MIHYTSISFDIPSQFIKLGTYYHYVTIDMNLTMNIRITFYVGRSVTCIYIPFNANFKTIKKCIYDSYKQECDRRLKNCFLNNDLLFYMHYHILCYRRHFISSFGL
jgi:hypothetical protein